MNAPTISRPVGFQGTSPQSQHEPTSPIGKLIAAAREPLRSIRDARNDAIRFAAQSLQTTLAGFERSTGRLATYLIDEIRIGINRTLAAAANAAKSAREDEADANRALQWLAQIPALIDGDTVERARDQEIRFNARSMSAKERADLLADMRKGGQERVLLALARSPLPDELEKQAVELYTTTANAAKRKAVQEGITAAKETVDQADTLRRAAEATMVVLEAFDGVDVRQGAGVAPNADPAMHRERQALRAPAA